MATCDECGKHENLPYQCRRCGRTFCAEHRLPENHECPGLSEWDDPSGVFDSGFDDSVNQQGRTKGALDRLTGTGGPMSYFRGNMSYVFLGVMWITFAFQFFIFPVLGFGPRTELWQTVFVLRPGRIGYVWTWFTSMFAHGGFTHIAFNSIALYFFGPVVERYINTRRFVLLFFAAGILAGLAQVASTLLTVGAVGAGVVGASGAIMGVLGVLTVLNPGLRVYLYFVIPMPLWVLTFGFAAFSIVAGFGVSGGVGALGGNVAHLAHLAGLVVGLLYGARVKQQVRTPESLQFGRGGGGGGGMGGPGRF
ncbi:rhomboid family intramembrane serine protease [Halogeometricum sp. S1BR25-6]|uniref:Rhomboid family intramembrane serine protease n=1 Tax=Halogeometricum salsisoli TaxID=2950536 RepID=A0ABU2GB17_9EURY|nr:rhomboid family intramembrane serine protease [Halogeometricum sp. S1BR25-6]MDS0297990.1 rhomboid family intramembrane serine protease [Halogeometricum sp. S1BR25-6]